MTETEDTPIERDLGPQPLDAIMSTAGLDNHALVAACKDPLTHKAVQRARRGRRLTPHMKRRITETLNKALVGSAPAPASEADSEQEPVPAPSYKVKDLFNY